MGIRYRELKTEDLMQLSWSGTKTHLEHVADSLNLGPDKFVLLGVENDGEIFGYGGIDFVKFEDGGFLKMFTIREDMRNKGFGTTLFDQAHQKILTTRRSVAYLHVEFSNPDAKRLYERMGYVVIGTDTDSWEEEKADGSKELYETRVYIMRLELTS